MRHVRNLMMGAMFLFVALSMNCSGLLPGYRAVYAVRQAGDEVSGLLGRLAKVAHVDCFKACTPGKPCPEYVKCIAPWRKALEHWRDYVRPAINTALAATWGGLETAHVAGKKDANWLALLKPGLCALVGALAQWKHLLKGKGATIVGQLDAISKGVCK